MPSALDDRAADCWRPLLAIADSLGGTWPDAARRAAFLLSGGRDDRASGDELLLADVQRLFRARAGDRIRSSDLLSSLNELHDRAWAPRDGDTLTAQELSARFKPFGVKPRKLYFPDLREGRQVYQGYA